MLAYNTMPYYVMLCHSGELVKELFVTVLTFEYYCIDLPSLDNIIFILRRVSIREHESRAHSQK